MKLYAFYNCLIIVFIKSYNLSIKDFLGWVDLIILNKFA